MTAVPTVVVELAKAMEHSIIRFAEIQWNEIAPGVREKRFESESQTFRLLELAPGFEETDW